MRDAKSTRPASEFEEKVIQISRVSKKTKGGNKVGFSVLMVVGDKKGRVGVGLGKGPEVISAIRKGTKRAKKRMIVVPLDGTTIPFAVLAKRGAGKVLLKPAPKGSGVIAGGPVRSVVEVAGVRDISSKILGTQNQASSVYATFAALKEIQKLVALKNIKLKSIAQVEAEEEQKQLALEAKAKAEKKNQPQHPVSRPMPARKPFKTQPAPVAKTQSAKPANKPSKPEAAPAVSAEIK